MNEIRIIPITGIAEVEPGDDLAAMIVHAAGAGGILDNDVIVIAQKVVSKAEGRVVDTHDVHRVALTESVRVLRRLGSMVISETRHGFVCANAGVDSSNVSGDRAALLPIDPDLSGRRVRARINHLGGVNVGIIVSDTFGRAWRLGQTNVAIGVAGFDPFIDYRGTHDMHGRELNATRICIADELAGAAEMVMGKKDGVCAAIIRGVACEFGSGAAAAIARPYDEDLFR